MEKVLINVEGVSLKSQIVLWLPLVLGEGVAGSPPSHDGASRAWPLPGTLVSPRPSPQKGVQEQGDD